MDHPRGAGSSVPVVSGHHPFVPERPFDDHLVVVQGISADIQFSFMDREFLDQFFQ